MKCSLSIVMLLCPLFAMAQLAVSVSPPRIVGQKSVVKLVMRNRLNDSVESARAMCFLLDTQGRIISQSTRWVIGGSKDRPPLAPKHETMFNFVLSSPQPWTTTNLTARVSFSRVILADHKLADVQRDVTVSTAAK